MIYANCNVVGSLLPKRIACTDGNLNVLYFLFGERHLLTKQVTGQPTHFSEYAMAW
jgi:hypothetical protein